MTTVIHGGFLCELGRNLEGWVQCRQHLDSASTSSHPHVHSWWAACHLRVIFMSVVQTSEFGKLLTNHTNFLSTRQLDGLKQWIKHGELCDWRKSKKHHVAWRWLGTSAWVCPGKRACHVVYTANALRVAMFGGKHQKLQIFCWIILMCF